MVKVARRSHQPMDQNWRRIYAASQSALDKKHRVVVHFAKHYQTSYPRNLREELLDVEAQFHELQRDFHCAYLVVKSNFRIVEHR